jgi:ComF family protein
LALLLSVLDWQVDVIVPVPLHAQRFQVRGYNQAGEIAHHLAEFAEIPFMPEASQRIRYTQTQVGLSREERLQNVVESFSADESMVRGKSVLIVDDVKTTGATLAACAQPMLDAGADTVFALTVTAAT